MTNSLTSLIVSVALWVTALLFLLNAVCVYVFRKRHKTEMVSYLAAGLVELALFVFTLLFFLGVLKHIPWHLPPGLPFNRAELGATIAVAIGLFPVAYWHRTSMRQWQERIQKDTQTMQKHEAGVRVRAPGEWMN